MICQIATYKQLKLKKVLLYFFFVIHFKINNIQETLEYYIMQQPMHTKRKKGDQGEIELYETQ